MAAPHQELERRLRAAFGAVSPGADPVLRASDRADFQANGAMGLAKQLGRPPREVAEEVLAHADLDDLCSVVEVSGPGFVNLTLADAVVAAQLPVMAAAPALGLTGAAHPRHVVVDYSSPNVAKELHVGHLRSTVIGDSLCRLLDAVGHRVTRENHVGDWGTPFGMLIEHLVDTGGDGDAEVLSVGDLDAFYRDARVKYDADPAFAERSRHRVVLLQAGDPETLRLWRALVAESERHFDAVYRLMGVQLTSSDIVGESFYNPMLAGVVADLDAAGLLVESDGARCVFVEGFTNRDGQPLPLIVQKSDGGFGYAATDLACLRDRVDRLGAERILYVVGAEQAQHLQMCFAVARMAGWVGESVATEHVPFGLVLGTDRKRLRSRSGGAVLLMALLDEAVERADAALAARDQALEADERRLLAEAVGVGAVKYADLSNERIRDYVFDWDRMLAFEGSTGPYLQYAHARIRSIFRRLPGPYDVAAGPPSLAEPAERALAMALLAYDAAVHDAVDHLAPNRLCAYLYDLASAFTTFYEACPVLRAADDDTRTGRLLLCHLTAAVLAAGMWLLGMEAPERM